MKKNTIVLVACLTLLGCAETQPENGAAPSVTPNERATTLSTGEDTYKRVLEIAVSDLDSTYQVGSPIRITVQIKNHGPKGPGTNAQPRHPTAQLFPHLTVWVEKDAKLSSEQLPLPIENRIWIKQGETFEHSVDLAKVRLLSAPGKYLVSVGHWNYMITDLGDWTGTLRSRSQTIVVEKNEQGRVFNLFAHASIPAAAPAKWLQTCVYELAGNQENQVQWFSGMGANDVAFMPQVNAVDEIFRKCNSVKPLSVDQVPIYKAWLKDRISEIQSITAGTTRSQLNQYLLQNGGLSTPKAAIYSHKECNVLKVRIEFKPDLDKQQQLIFTADDKVKAISMPYLGLFITD
jgi:hypothetical protein